ncbi:MAG TPA: carboxypeptidase-like regulatory domain-containing protein [Chitinophagaceae bacterium]
MKQLLLSLAFVLAAHFLYASAGTNTTNGTCVSGTVLDANTKKPLAEVTVVAVHANNKTETVTTNAQGQFRIVSLPQGTYTLRLSKEDYKNEKKEVVLKPETSIRVTVEMVAEELETTSHRSWWDKFDLYL